MKNILFIGNSQITCVLDALKATPEFGAACHVHALLQPGPHGPDFTAPFSAAACSDPLVIQELFIKKYYDVVYFGAVGYYDNGVDMVHASPAITQGLCHDFLPRTNAWVSRPLSKALISRCFNTIQSGHANVRSLKMLRDMGYRTVVQPYPNLSVEVIDSPKWTMNKLYREPVRAYQFYNGLRDGFLSGLAAELGFHLLDRPVLDAALADFLPADYVDQNAADLIHPNMKYGQLVVGQLTNFLQSLEA